MFKTYYPKPDDIKREWVLVDANDQTLGRLVTQIATLLLGKHKPEFTPGVEVGDHVIVVNARRIRVTGNKMEDKMYYRTSGRPGGLKSINLRGLLEKHPERVIERAVWGMLPHNRYGRRLMKRLRVYAGPDHPHAAQNPRPVSEVLPASEE
ncbi:MAG: 50S ribosomal protein L13 [Anaerolineae bacterium]|nr:MAG: 50S ribosomal protein L13 [Anaerolineae bacterium]